MTDDLASTHKSITKIVCFGLGALNHSKNFYESSLQHMTAFTIANRLTKAYKARGLANKPVDVILQDPCYTKKDQVLLSKLHQGVGGKLSCVSDPDGLLAIDSQTIVVAAFLPVEVPLLQIIADMFHGQDGESPAAIICDNVEVDLERELYTFGDRGSPQVARFLTQHYVESNFEDHVLEQALVEDVYGESGRPYWLSEMHIFTRWIHCSAVL